MTDNSDKLIIATSDRALLEDIGGFIKQARLNQNKTQNQLAKEAGIVRSTLSLFENGEGGSMTVFIQLLRALNLLPLLQDFKSKQQISPLQLAKMDQKKRIRARSKGIKENKPKSNW